MERESTSEPDVYSFNIFKPIGDRATARTIYRNALAFLAGLWAVDELFSLWWDRSDLVSMTELLGTLLATALMVVIVLWVRQRGSRWAGAVILALGIVGLLAELTDTEAFSHGYGVTRGALLIDMGETAGLLWLLRSLLFAFRNGGSLRSAEAAAPGVSVELPSATVSDEHR